jgi:predicted O-methyltransferase YrrM
MSVSLEDFFAKYPRYLSLRAVASDAEIQRVILPRIDIYEELVRESSAMIQVADIATVFGKEAESLEITLRRFLGHWGNVSVEEVAKIALLAKAMKPRTVFEFGTFNGMTTLQIAMNVLDCQVYTLDLPEDVLPSYPHDEFDRLVSRKAGAQFDTKTGSFFSDLNDGRIVQLWGDSAKFDFSPYRNRVDLVFIDGGHNFPTVKADTENALSMLAPGGAILWHNYHDITCPDVTQYLLELSQRLKLYQLRNTALVVYKSLLDEAAKLGKLRSRVSR